MTNKSTLLRTLLDSSPLVRVMGAHNGISAKLAERNGFDAIWASGLEISASYGVPDASILTMSEFLDAARAMNEVVDIPVIADCDSGFGDASIVEHMVRKYEAAGIAAVCIEDKPFPKMNSFVDGYQRLLPIEQFCEKIRAAVCARSSAEMVVVARTEALVVGEGQREAMRRAKAYVSAGADVVLVHSKHRAADEILEFAQQWDGRAPLVAIPTTYFDVTVEELAAAGIRMVIYANHAMRSAVRAMDATMRSVISCGSTRGIEGAIASLDELFDLQGVDRIKAVRQ